MERLKDYLESLVLNKKAEPNSNLGGAIRYTIKHWDKLTKFLTVVGAPLDNNEAERALKLPIRSRKSSFFFKTNHGAYVGSMLMSLIATCLSAGVNVIEYLTCLQDNKKKVFNCPDQWLPWNYCEN